MKLMIIGKYVFTVTILLLHKIINACQNEIHGIVAYTFLNVGGLCEKINSFRQTFKQCTLKKIGYFFSASRCT